VFSGCFFGDGAQLFDLFVGQVWEAQVFHFFTDVCLGFRRVVLLGLSLVGVWFGGLSVGLVRVPLVFPERLLLC